MLRTIAKTTLLLFVLLSSLNAQETCYVTDHKQLAPDVTNANATRSLVVVAFGTSVTWGDGLLSEHTFRYGVADWLAKTTGQKVDLWTFAHSAAYLTTIPNQGVFAPDPSNGELNGNYPSLDQQIDCAAGAQHSLGNASLVLLDGCINEVNATDIVAPWTSQSEILDRTHKACGETMKLVLAHAQEKFPSAIIVVAGYYPIISPKSSIFGFSGTRRVTKTAIARADAKSIRAHKPATFAQRGRSEEKQYMGGNSEVFYQASKSDLQSAIASVSAGRPGKMFFAGLPEVQIGSEHTVNPNFAYGARKTHEWLLPFQFLCFVIHADEVFKIRQAACKQNYEPGTDRFVCESNAAFHPNLKGAEAYTSSIEAVIPESAVASWKLAF